MLGRRLAELRKQRKLNQQGLADILGVSLNTIKSWESGRRSPGTIEELTKIADFFEISTDYLLGRDELSGPRGKLIELTNRLSDDECKKALDFFQAFIKRF